MKTSSFGARKGVSGTLPTSGKGNRHRLKVLKTLERPAVPEDDEWDTEDPVVRVNVLCSVDRPKRVKPDPRSPETWGKILAGRDKIQRLVARAFR